MNIRRGLSRGVCFLLLLVSVGAAADDEMMGFIVDNSVSHIGRNFYNAFCDRLRATSRLDFNLVVRERPSARWGSLIWVEYEQRVLYRRFISPNTAQLQAVAYEAADLVREEIVQSKLLEQLQDHTDLEKDEL